LARASVPHALIAAAIATVFVVLPVESPRAATAADISPAFGNTLLSTYPDGRKARLWLNKDGTYNGKGRRGGPSSGRWAIKGEKLCLSQMKPVKAPFAFCTPVNRGGVGASWSAKAPTGEKITVTVVKGRAG
jgi:hypothetical protein